MEDESKVVSMSDDIAQASIMDMVESLDNREERNLKEDFLFEEFEELFNSVLEVQENVSRDINGETIRSLPIDLEVELSRAIAWMRRKYNPYNEARRKYAEGLGFVYDGERNAYVLKPQKKSKIEVSDEQKKALAEDRQAKFEMLMESNKTLMKSKFNHSRELFEKILPLPGFTQERLTEARILFKNCQRVQPFLQYCIK